MSDLSRAQLIDLLEQLDAAVMREAPAFAVVTTDAYTGDVVNATGPFTQAEQALVETGRIDADWRKHAEDLVEANALKHVVVPLWEPTQ